MRVPGGSPAGEPELARAAEGLPPAAAGDEMTWPVYRSEEHRFELARPPSHRVEVDPAPAGSRSRAVPLAEIRIRDPNLDSAAPSSLTVVVYEATGEPLDAWLARVDPEGVETVSEPAALAGHPAVRRCRTTYLAPGCSVYVARDPFVYRFVPHGEAGEKMLASLRLL